MTKKSFLAGTMLWALSSGLWAQGAVPRSRPTPQTEPAAAVHKQIGPADIIMPHLTDSKHLEYPCVKGWGEWACGVTLPTWNVHIAGKTVDFGPTKHVVFLVKLKRGHGIGLHHADCLFV